uniref:hypothetical protein n=1 Tax=Escherichia coli TaxID=562 RepID=UPI00215B111B
RTGVLSTLVCKMKAIASCYSSIMILDFRTEFAQMQAPSFFLIGSGALEFQVAADMRSSPGYKNAVDPGAT